MKYKGETLDMLHERYKNPWLITVTIEVTPVNLNGFNHICYKENEKFLFGDIISFSCERGAFYFCLRTKEAKKIFVSRKAEDIIYIV